MTWDAVAARERVIARCPELGQEFPVSLRDHVRRHAYGRRHGATIAVMVRENLLDEPVFREVRFADGFAATFLSREDGTWFQAYRSQRRLKAAR